MNTPEKYPVGTKVYYSLDAYETGEPTIYSGTITRIDNSNIKLLNTELPAKVYYLDTEIGLMSNSFYTIQELFQLKEKLENTYNEYRKDLLLSQEVGTNE